MKDSIVVDMRYAEYDMIDGTPNVHRHHIFEGTANRRLSDEDGLWVPLSYEHHMHHISIEHFQVSISREKRHFLFNELEKKPIFHLMI